MNRSTLLRGAWLALMLGTSLMAEDWPHWRGPRRDGTSGESSRWEQGAWPPRQAWRASVGEGSTSPIVAGGRLYVLGWSDQRDHLHCLDAHSGKLLWRRSYAAPRYGRHATGDQGLYAGPTSTPEYDSQSGLLVTLSADGDLRAWDTRREGQPVWHVNLYQEYAPPQRPRVGRSGLRDYGYTTAPLVWGDWVMVEAGSPQGTVMAFDKHTGKLRWSSQATDPAGHTGGLVPLEVAGKDLLAVHTFAGLVVLSLEEPPGRTVATFPWRTEFANNIATPVACDDSVLITSAYNHGKLARLRIASGGAEPVWEIDWPSKVCTPVVFEGHVYWAWNKMLCVDLATGQGRWEAGGYDDPGSCIVTADARLIVYAGRGRLTLVESARRAPDRYVKLAETGPLFQTEAWPHVVLADGRLYCKDRDGNLVCLVLDAKRP